MSYLHEASISKPRKIVGYALSILASIIVLLSGGFKFMQQPDTMALLDRLGMADQAFLIGAVEVLVAVCYWIPRASNLGFFLFCAYCGGIVVGELIMGDVPVPGLAIGAMVLTGTLLRKPSLMG
jgi:hypothetical protein